MVLDHVPVVIRFQVCIFDILNTAYIVIKKTKLWL